MAEFISKKATFDKSCMSLYDKQKLNRKRKLQTDQDQGDHTPERSTRKTSGSNTDSSNCFFCNDSKQNEELHLCQTFYLDMRIRKIAHEMNIDKLLRKLSVEDTVAIESKYHHTCLSKFYKSYRKHNKDEREQANEQLMEGINFSKVLEFIEESILASDETTTPVFYLKEITEMYKKHFIAQGATETANSVHRTRLKNAILENIPGLCATKSGKYVLLTLNSELGRALFNTCLSSYSSDGKSSTNNNKKIFSDMNNSLKVIYPEKGSLKGFPEVYFSLFHC